MALRVLYARRGRVALTGAGLATAGIMVLLAGARAMESPGIRHSSEVIAALALAIAFGLQLRSRLGPIIKLSEDRIELGPLAARRRQLISLSDVDSVEDETSLLAKVWEILRIRLKSERTIRVYLTELDREDRAAVRAALEQAAKS
jgi:hypothetical protein